MSDTRRRDGELPVPTVADAVAFRAKAALFQLRRGMLNLANSRLRRHVIQDSPGLVHIVATSRTPLWVDEALAERPMQTGKVHNLRLAARRLDGLFLPAGSLFSFWKQLGALTRLHGYVHGRELREGCLVPAVGGGICQLSNALYQVALDAGCEIIERHAHSRKVPGSAASKDRDATVFWNYVDLRWLAPRDLLLKVSLTHDELVVALYAAQPIEQATLSNNAQPLKTYEALTGAQAASCMTCGVDSCFRHSDAENRAKSFTGATAWLLDEQWPEFQELLKHESVPNSDVLLLPSKRRSQVTNGSPSRFRKTYTAELAAARRSLAVRRVSAISRTGAARRLAELQSTQTIALALASRLPWDATRLVVAQSFLPFLWLNGDCGGREFDVLMTRLPMRELHRRLDEAYAEKPDRGSLADFRADEKLVAAEEAALAAARRIITPHPSIAALFPGRSLLRPWIAPPPAPSHRQGTAANPRTIYFPGPTAARKGAYEVRELARKMNLVVLLSGSELEGENFWQDVETLRLSRTECLARASCVVQPAVVEDQPRTLLAALAASIPVICTPACGIEATAGVTLVSPHSPAELSQAYAGLTQDPHGIERMPSLV